MLAPRLNYRELSLAEVPLLGTIDRSERMTEVYRSRGGVLELEAVNEDVQGWEPAELRTFILRLEALIASGGIVYGAWEDAKLIGLGSLHVGAVGGNSAVMKLDMLYVSAGYRGHGIGRQLTKIIANAARQRGATALYISATPTRATVDAYLRMGAKVLSSPDLELYREEPNDIHLLLEVR